MKIYEQTADVKMNQFNRAFLCLRFILALLA